MVLQENFVWYQKCHVMLYVDAFQIKVILIKAFIFSHWNEKKKKKNELSVNKLSYCPFPSNSTNLDEVNN